MKEVYCKMCKQITYWLNNECYYCGSKPKRDDMNDKEAQNIMDAIEFA